jgi:hypothetical protein
MVTEQAPSLEEDDFNLEDLELPIRKIDGIGFEALGDALLSERFGIYGHLKEQRPLYLVTDYKEELTCMNDFVKDLVASRFHLEQLDTRYISSIYARQFDERAALAIINDYTRPIILPMAIGPGGQPSWRVGPIWMLYSEGNYSAFKEQLERLKFD